MLGCTGWGWGVGLGIYQFFTRISNQCLSFPPSSSLWPLEAPAATSCCGFGAAFSLKQGDARAHLFGAACTAMSGLKTSRHSNHMAQAYFSRKRYCRKLVNTHPMAVRKIYDMSTPRDLLLAPLDTLTQDNRM